MMSSGEQHILRSFKLELTISNVGVLDIISTINTILPIDTTAAIQEEDKVGKLVQVGVFQHHFLDPIGFLDGNG